MDTSEKPEPGVSLKVKIFVIFLTLATIVVFSAVLFRLVTKFTSSSTEVKELKNSEEISSPEKIQTWAQHLRIVGDKLLKAGLKEKAIEQYANFLQHANMDSKTRAEVSQTLGNLYAELGDCGNALVWFYQAEVAGPDPSRLATLESQIDTCLKEVKSK